MRILHLHWGFPPIIGGVETHLATMLPVMVHQKHKVSLITGSVEGSKTRYVWKGVSIYRTPLMDLNWLFKRGFAGLESEVGDMIRDVVDREKPEIIHVHNMHYFSKMHITILQEQARKKGVPLILTAHNVWDDMLFLDLVKSIKWDHIISVSHFIKRELIGVGCADTSITVVHHGVDTEIFRPDVPPKIIAKKYPELKNKKVIFHPARMGMGKGCDVSIKAIRIVKDKFPDVILIQAGTKNIIDWGETQQKDIAYMVGLIKDLNLEKYMLINVFSLDEIAELYAASDVCVYPSRAAEPFGLTMLEALSSARPMVVTNMGGMPEIIQDGVNGYVVHVGDYEALAMRIMQLLDNDSLRKRLGNTGMQIVKGHYSKEIMTDRHLEIYRKLIAKG